MFSAVINFLKKGSKFIFLSFLTIILIWIGYFYYLDQKHINFLQYSDKEMKEMHWHYKDNFFFRAASSKWQFLKKQTASYNKDNYSNEYALVTIDPSSDPKWFSELYFLIGENEKIEKRAVHFYFSQQCDDKKTYKTSEKFSGGEFKEFYCWKGKWLFHSYRDTTDNDYIEFTLDGYQASYYVNLKDEFRKKMLLEQKNVD